MEVKKYCVSDQSYLDDSALFRGAWQGPSRSHLDLSLCEPCQKRGGKSGDDDNNDDDDYDYDILADDMRPRGLIMIYYCSCSLPCTS